MDADTASKVWSYMQGELRGDKVVDLFHTLFKTGEFWNVIDPQYPNHFLEQTASFFSKGYFNQGRGE